MYNITQMVFTIGRIVPSQVNMLGTGFIVRADGLIATTHHVTGGNDQNLVVLAPHMHDLNAYQDISDNRAMPVGAKIIESDPIRDLCILKVDRRIDSPIPNLGNFDNENVGSELEIFGFPHCVHGRRVLTFQRAEIGAKVLMNSNGVKSKHAVVNIQARPGQSGSPIYSANTKTLCGVLVGAWVPGVAVMLGDINPHELHQTTHCISAEHLKGML